ncbi:g4377 [Coccomyxa elongata]
MGPDCFIPVVYRGTSGKTTSVDRITSNGAQGHGGVLGEAPRSTSGGVMEQYMEASHSLLSSVNGDSLTSRQEGRQVGAREGQVLDDVVIVKVGRSVKSVYDEEGEQDWLERTTGAGDRPIGASGEAMQREREREGSSEKEGAAVDAAGGAEQCESGLDGGSNDEGTYNPDDEYNSYYDDSYYLPLG